MSGLPPGAVLDNQSKGLPPGAVVDQGEVDTTTDSDKGFVNPLQVNLANPTPLGERMKSVVGILDVGLMGVSAGVAEVTSGVAGLTALAITGDWDYAKKRVEDWENFITVGPFTESGENVLTAMMPPLSKAETNITDYAEEKADGDPEVATAIKTGILASIDIAAFAVPGAKAVINNSKLLKMRKQVIAEAERLGIEIHLDSFADDVADAAKMVGSESAGEAATEYVTALRNAEYLAKLKKNSLYAAALDENLFVSTSPIRKMGADLAAKLDGPFDLDADNMVVVRRTLDDMHSRKLGLGSGQTLAVHFSKFEMLRKRINNRISDSKGSPKAALINIKNELDGWMTAEFNKATMQNGGYITSGGALSGDEKGFLTYLSARKAAAEHAWFSDTRVIADLIKKDTSVDQFAQWLIGASSVSKKGSAAVVNKMKLLLGEDSPAIAAVRADFVYQLTEPLLQLEPNFKQFANNYDKILRKNKPLADSLGLQASDVAILADYALVARQLPASGRFYSVREIIQTVARLSVGHGVAKGAARVTFATKVMNALGRVDAVTQKQIIAAAVDVRFDQPVVPKGTPVYSAIIAGAALSGIEENE